MNKVRCHCSVLVVLVCTHDSLYFWCFDAIFFKLFDEQTKKEINSISSQAEIYMLLKQNPLRQCFFLVLVGCVQFNYSFFSRPARLCIVFAFSLFCALSNVFFVRCAFCNAFKFNDRKALCWNDTKYKKRNIKKLMKKKHFLWVSVCCM